MAHKIGLVLLASLQLINGQIYGLRNNGADSEGFGYQTPIVSFGHKRNDDKHSDSDGHPLGVNNVDLGFNILSDAHDVKEHDDDQKVISWKVNHDDNNDDESHDKVKVRKNKQYHNKNDDKKEDHKDNDHKNDDNEDDHKDDHKVDNHKDNESELKRVFIKVDHKEPKKEKSDDRPEKSSIDVNDAIQFHSLKYVDSDKHGELVKAPITVVTAPLVATLDHDDGHRVAKNEVKGKSNCPQCKEDDDVKEKADKSLFKYNELLKTEVKPLIDHVEVKSEDDSNSKEENESDSSESKNKKSEKKDESKEEKKSDKKQKVQKSHLRKELAEGERLENAPLVIGKVVILDDEEKNGDHKRKDDKRRNHD